MVINEQLFGRLEAELYINPLAVNALRAMRDEPSKSEREVSDFFATRFHSSGDS